MADLTILPGFRARLVGPDGVVTPEYYRFFQKLVGSSEIQRIVTVIDQIQANPPQQGTLLAIDGIVGEGSLPSGFMQISLEGITQVAGGSLLSITIDDHGRVIESKPVINGDPSIVIFEGTSDTQITVGIIDCGIIVATGLNRITSTGDLRVTSTADQRITG